LELLWLQTDWLHSGELLTKFIHGEDAILEAKGLYAGEVDWLSSVAQSLHLQGALPGTCLTAPFIDDVFIVGLKNHTLIDEVELVQLGIGFTPEGQPFANATLRGHCNSPFHFPYDVSISVESARLITFN
jgi:hypothetical protein